MTVAQNQFFWSYVDMDSCQKRQYTRKELFGKVKRVEFEVIRVTSFVSFRLP